MTQPHSPLPDPTLASSLRPDAQRARPGPGEPAPPAQRSRVQRDLRRLGLWPCGVLALVLTTWFTHARLQALDAVFDAEGMALARQVAAMSDLSLYAGDVRALQNVVDAALRTGQASRVEISNSAGIYVSAGPSSAKEHRSFSAAVMLRDAAVAEGIPQVAQAVGDARTIGLVQAFRDTKALRQTRTHIVLTSAALVLLTLLGAWLAVRHMAYRLSQPLAQVSQAVARLRAGHFEVRCTLAPSRHDSQVPDELQSLADNVNQLAEYLQEHQKLSESRVREATAVALMRMTDAEQAAQSRTRFLAAASHDLRQPLHAMGLFIDGLLNTALESQRPALLRLQENAAFMGTLLDDLLEISRLDAQMLTPNLGPVSLKDLFDALDAQFCAPAAASGVRLVWRDRGRWVHSDAALLQRILSNLVGNAIRHAPLNGTVLVAARRCEAGVRLEVRDNGVGIAPVHQTRVFEEFYQVANTERDRRKGFGLGLAICARIAALLGTRVALRSALAQGSTFSLQLPPLPVVAPPTPAGLTSASLTPASMATASGTDLSGVVCLLMDEDPHTHAHARTLLTQWGCDVTACQSEPDAQTLVNAREAHYDAIIWHRQGSTIDATRDGEAPCGPPWLEIAQRRWPHALLVVYASSPTPCTAQALPWDHRQMRVLPLPLVANQLQSALAQHRAAGP